MEAGRFNDAISAMVTNLLPVYGSLERATVKREPSKLSDEDLMARIATAEQDGCGTVARAAVEHTYANLDFRLTGVLRSSRFKPKGVLSRCQTFPSQTFPSQTSLAGLD
jgi:hypothetical protein